MDCSSTTPSFSVVSTSGDTFIGDRAIESSARLSASLPLASTNCRSTATTTEKSCALDIPMVPSKKPSSIEFAEQIRQLEIEGSKLRSATVIALAEGSPTLITTECKSPLSSSLASLVDISAEQKTIAHLRSQLENQRRETERLQSHLLAGSSAGRTFSTLAFSSPTKTAFSTVPASELLSASSSRRAFEFVPPSHMERALKESQEQVIELRKKLQDAVESAEQQKRQFRVSNEELKSRLHETIVNRDTVLDLRQKESASQEALIDKLQMSLSQLQDKFRLQEQALGELNKQAESSSQSSYASTMVVGQLRSLLAARERDRGRPFLDGESAASCQSSSALTLMLEKCLQETGLESENYRLKALQLEQELEERKKSFFEKEQAMIRDHQDRLKSESEDAVRKVNQITSEQERRLQEANERASNARTQAATLQEQLRLVEEQQHQQSRLKNETIGELEQKLRQIKEDYEDDRAKWQDRRQALEMSLDEVQRELIQVRAEKSEAVRNQATADTKTEDLQMVVSRLEADVAMERERVREQREREEELRLKALSLEGQVTLREQEKERLERMLEVVKQEASVQMHDRVIYTEKQERDRYVDQINTLTSQLTLANELKTKMAVDSERLRMETETVRQQLNDLRLDYQATQTQLEAARCDKDQALSSAHQAQDQTQRLRDERDHYRSCAQDKAEEILQLRTAVEKATLQLEEKERVLSTLQQQSSSISQLMDVNTRTSSNMQEERERLNQLAESRAAALESSRASQEAMAKKLKLREKRVKELEEERVKLVDEMGVISQELNLLQQERDQIFAELKESRQEVARVTQTKDSLKRESAHLKNSHAKEVDKLQKRLKEAERDFKLTHKALKSKDSVDNKAVKVADQIQKEITAKRSELDNLRSKVRRQDEKIETLTKEKLAVERDKDNLKSSLARALLHTSQLTEELEASEAHSGKLHRKNQELEEALEKEAMKGASTQAQLEQFDQEVATMKLKHQLDLKEAAQLSQKSSKISWVAVPDKAGLHAAGQLSSQASLSDRNTNNSTSASRQGQRKSAQLSGPVNPCQETDKELHSLLVEMKRLIRSQREINHPAPSSPGTSSRSSPLKGRTANRRRSRSSSPDKNRLSSSLHSVDGDPSLMTSYPPQSANATELSVGLVSRSNPSTPHRGNPSESWQTDLAAECSGLSDDSLSEMTGVSSSLDKHLPTDGCITVVPDTQELCRRLEEKIANLTRMGSNLQHENEEMAQLITAQGSKLKGLRRNEREIMSDRNGKR